MPGFGLLHDVVSARAVGGLRLHLRFDDGVEGEVDLRSVIREFKGNLARLADPEYVAQVRVSPELGTVTWPNGVDLDEVVLYCAVRGVPVPSYEERPADRRPRARGSRPPSAARDGKRRRDRR